MASPFDIRENKLLLPAFIVLLAAVIFAGSLAWYGPSGAGEQGAGYRRPVLQPGEKNPADVLPVLHGRTVSGFVTSVAEQSIEISSKPPQSTNAPSSVQSERYGVDASTVVYARGKFKSQSQIQRELEDFNTAIAYADPSASTIYRAPDPYEHIAVPLMDIQPGTPVVLSLDADNATVLSIFLLQR